MEGLGVSEIYSDLKQFGCFTLGARGIFVVKQRFLGFCFPRWLFVFVCLCVCVRHADSAVGADSSASLKELLRLR